jgi:Uma2 family endonuclease
MTGSEETPAMTTFSELPAPPPGGYTGADLPALFGAIEDRFEILDGQVRILGPRPVWHSEAAVALQRALREIAPEPMVIAWRMSVNLGRDVLVPDLLVVSREAVTAGSLVFQPPDVHLVIEVTPPGATASDRAGRPAMYAGAGIPCYWRVDNDNGAMVISTFQRQPENGYAPDGVFRDRIKAGQPFPIDIELPEVTW